MSLALAFVAALSGVEPAFPAQRDHSLAELVRVACVDTGLRREVVERTARANRWNAARITRQTSEQGWSLAYRVDAASIIVSNIPVAGDADPSQASFCTVSIANPPSDWMADVEQLAFDLGLVAESAGELSGPAEMHVWSKLGAQTLTAAYQFSNRTVAVTLSRQVVTSSQ